MKILMHHASRMALFSMVIAGALLAGTGSDEAWAIKLDPLEAAEQISGRSSELPLTPDMAHKKRLLTLNYSRGPHTDATLPEVRGTSKQIYGIQITPTSASWKVNGLKPGLVRLLIKVQLHFGQPLHIISGCRSKKHNKRVGGARRSQHLHCNAADFQIPGVSKNKLAAFLRRMPERGGVGVYCRSSYVHLDIGPKRQWYWACKKRKKYKKRRVRRNRKS